ncbi:biotin transporter BioY [Lysinibacillus sp. 3P01SB]|uniref:biotin transporter BioY n=1 Tax=Lysinibacillus sp. 3P01SB TaxID=3132284 RepID=UPI0039A70917
MKISVFPMVLTALCAAIIAVLAQVSIPLPLVPITGQTLAIGLVVTILGLKYGTYSVLLYIMLGAIGLPVFQGFSGGLSIIAGPTGGYIVGFIPCALVIGYYLEKTRPTFTHAFTANLIGMIVTLFFGALWLKIVADLTWTGALVSGVTPFLVVGIIKAAIAAWAGVIIRNRLLQAKLLQPIA